MNLKEVFPNIKEWEPLAPYTTFGLESVAKWFLLVETPEELKEVILKINSPPAGLPAQAGGIPYIILAGGSNMVFPETLDKLVVYIKSKKLPEVAEGTIECEAGQPLAVLVDTAINAGLKGLEQLSGIPGTVGGAIIGNAGAYGREISDSLISVKVFDGEKEIELKKSDCDFSYRNSRFKKDRSLIVLSAKFELEKSDSQELKKISQEIIAKREEKYPPGLKCPGSFYKNLLVKNLSAEALAKIPADKIMFGKIPSGYLLEEVGAKGMKEGNIAVADYHGNLILNNGGGVFSEVEVLDEKLKKLVKEKFGIEIEEEVRIVNSR